MESKLKILKVVNSKDEGGVFTCETQYLKKMLSKGILVDLIIVGNGRQLEVYKQLCCNFFVVPEILVAFNGSVVNRIVNIIKSYFYGKSISKKLKANLNPKYSAVIYRRENLMFLSSLLASALKTNCFWHMANSVNGSVSRVVYSTLCTLFKIEPIANSKYTKWTIGKQCSEVVYPGFDPARVLGGESSIRSRFSTNAAELVIFGMLTRIDEHKAVDVVIAAFLRANLGKKCLLVIGGGPLDTVFAEKIKALITNSENVKLIGSVSNVNDFYCSVDVMINGRKNPEPFGITIAESLGAGKPVIAYYKGGPEEMIEEGRNGWLIKEPTVEQYEAALLQAYQNRNKWKEMGAVGKMKSPMFSVDVNVEHLLKIIAGRCQNKF